VEAVSTRATTVSVRVVDRETLLLDGVFEVDLRTIKVGNTHLVDNDLNAIAKLDARVAVEAALVEVELVDEAGATPGLHREAKSKVIATFLGQQAAHLLGSGIRQRYAVGGSTYRSVSHSQILRPPVELFEQDRLSQDRTAKHAKVKRLVGAVSARIGILDAGDENLRRRKLLGKL